MINDNQKEQCNIIYNYLKEKHTKVTKEELCAILGWKYNSSADRRVRNLLNIIKKRRPVIATPDSKGYYLCKDQKDLEECVHQWRYIDSIIQDLEETKKPLIKFYEQYNALDHEI